MHRTGLFTKIDQPNALILNIKRRNCCNDTHSYWS